jgi:hypothetical protein
VKETLSSLMRLRITVLRLAGEGWNPQMGVMSVAVAGFEDRAVTSTRRRLDACDETCPLYGRGPRHGHFVIQIGLGFLGVLQHYAVPASPDAVGCAYEFTATTNPDSAEELRAHQRAGRTPSVSLPAKLFGAAKWSGLSRPATRVLGGILHEVTRAPSNQRADRASVFTGNMVVGARKNQRLACPFLSPKGRYVAFGGNGKRPGMGYLVIGRRNRGWLHKSDYDVPVGVAGLSRQLKSFFSQVKILKEKFGFITAGLQKITGRWYGLAELTAMASGASGWERLEDILVRFYAPDDYQDRLRDYFSAQGAFVAIGGEAPAGWSSIGEASLDLKTRAELVGLTQHSIAAALEVSQPYVCQLFCGRKNWPSQLRERFEAMLSEAEGASGKHT